MITPQDFIAKWGAPDGVPGPAHALNEEQGAQSHFLDLCELLPFPAGLTPADTAHQRTEEVAGGALIPADLPDQQCEAGAGRRSGAISKSEAYEPPASAPPPPGHSQRAVPQPNNASLKNKATQIAPASKRLLALNLERSGAVQA